MNDSEQYLSDYELVKENRTCNRITTKEECERAAKALGAKNTTASIGNYTTGLPYCFFKGKYIHERDTSLWFSTPTTSNYSCSNDAVCICKASGNLDDKYYCSTTVGI